MPIYEAKITLIPRQIWIGWEKEKHKSLSFMKVGAKIPSKFIYKPNAMAYKMIAKLSLPHKDKGGLVAAHGCHLAHLQSKVVQQSHMIITIEAKRHLIKSHTHV